MEKLIIKLNDFRKEIISDLKELVIEKGGKVIITGDLEFKELLISNTEKDLFVRDETGNLDEIELYSLDEIYSIISNLGE